MGLLDAERWALGAWTRYLGRTGFAASRHVGSSAPETEPVSPALAGGFCSTEPPRQSLDCILETPPVTNFCHFYLASALGSQFRTFCGIHAGVLWAPHRGLFSPSGSSPLLISSSHKLLLRCYSPCFFCILFIRIVAHTLGPSYSPKLGVQRQICFFLVTFSFHKKFLIE